MLHRLAVSIPRDEKQLREGMNVLVANKTRCSHSFCACSKRPPLLKLLGLTTPALARQRSQVGLALGRRRAWEVH